MTVGVCFYTFRIKEGTKDDPNWEKTGQGNLLGLAFRIVKICSLMRVVMLLRSEEKGL